MDKTAILIKATTVLNAIVNVAFAGIAVEII
jgi:hypothetical protein